jgi:hypothetical protein
MTLLARRATMAKKKMEIRMAVVTGDRNLKSREIVVAANLTTLKALREALPTFEGVPVSGRLTPARIERGMVTGRIVVIARIEMANRVRERATKKGATMLRVAAALTASLAPTSCLPTLPTPTASTPRQRNWKKPSPSRKRRLQGQCRAN